MHTGVQLKHSDICRGTELERVQVFSVDLQTHISVIATLPECAWNIDLGSMAVHTVNTITLLLPSKHSVHECATTSKQMRVHAAAAAYSFRRA